MLPKDGIPEQTVLSELDVNCQQVQMQHPVFCTSIDKLAADHAACS